MLSFNNLHDKQLPVNENLETLLTVVQAAAYLSLSVKRLNELVRLKKIGCVQISPRERRFTTALLQEFIASRTLTPPKMIDHSENSPLPLPLKEMKSQRGDRASLRKEMSTWQS